MNCDTDRKNPTCAVEVRQFLKDEELKHLKIEQSQQTEIYQNGDERRIDEVRDNPV